MQVNLRHGGEGQLDSCSRARRAGASYLLGVPAAGAGTQKVKDWFVRPTVLSDTRATFSRLFASDVCSPARSSRPRAMLSSGNEPSIGHG